MRDIRIGKRLKSPTPKCPECDSYLLLSLNRMGSYWRCHKCKSEYEVGS